MTTFDVQAYLDRAEGPHFDRKSLWEGAPGRKRPRDRKAIRDQIAAYIAAFANAEGGVLLLGVEDDGAITGHNLPTNVVQTMLRVPAERLTPPQPPGFTVQVGEHELLAFEVPMAGAPVQVVGDGYPLRMGESTVQAAYEQIQALKFRGLMQSFEAQPSLLTVEDLDATLLAQAQEGGGLAHLAASAYLIQRRLADVRGSGLVLRQAAELLFHAGLPEHPNAGVRIFRVVGRTRRTGLEHNVEELPRVEGALPNVLSETFAIINGLLRRPSRLTAGGRFRQTSEYPEFSWKEAILNAVAHRDYGVQGRGVEVWLFDDRLEVINPGGLVEGVSLERLLRMERLHISRNPRLVRGLVDLGFMRDQGEGIPRMFSEMRAEFLPSPEMKADNHSLRLTLRNTMVLSEHERAFIEQLRGQELSSLAFRALLEVRRRGQIDNARLRKIGGLDTLAASKMLRNLRDQGLVAKHAAGSASYYTLADTFAAAEVCADEPRQASPPHNAPQPALGHGLEPHDESHELGAESHALGGESHELSGESHELGGESHELGGEGHERSLDPAHAIPEALRAEIAALGRRPKKRRLRSIIERLCRSSPRDAATLAAITDRNPEALRRHLRAMVDEGRLRLLYPDQPSHPKQAYVTTRGSLRISGEP